MTALDRDVSVIIPTLWRSEWTVQLVCNLLEWNRLLEIIIIDNNSQNRPYDFPSDACHILDFGENIYVNPAWNHGAQHAKGKYFLICNDDVLFEPQNLDPLLDTFPKSTVYGMHSRSFGYNEELKVDSEFYVGFGWGCIMLMEGKNYPWIPNDLKIFRGDDWIAYAHKYRRTFSIPMHGELSASHKGKFSGLKESDALRYEFYRRKSLYRLAFKWVDWFGSNFILRVCARLHNVYLAKPR